MHQTLQELREDSTAATTEEVPPLVRRNLLGAAGPIEFKDGVFSIEFPKNPPPGSDEEAQVMGFFSGLLAEDPDSSKVGYLQDYYFHHERLSRYMVAQHRLHSALRERKRRNQAK